MKPARKLLLKSVKLHAVGNHPDKNLLATGCEPPDYWMRAMVYSIFACWPSKKPEQVFE